MDLSFAELRQANINRNYEWNKGTEPISLTFRCTEIAGEVGELCEAIKKLERLRLGIAGGAELAEKDIDEFADVIIAVDLLAMDMNIDLSEVIRRKFNKTSEKHGLDTVLTRPTGEVE